MLSGDCIDPQNQEKKAASYTLSTKTFCFSLDRILAIRPEFGGRKLRRSELANQLFLLGSHELAHAGGADEAEAQLFERIMQIDLVDREVKLVSLGEVLVLSRMIGIDLWRANPKPYNLLGQAAALSQIVQAPVLSLPQQLSVCYALANLTNSFYQQTESARILTLATRRYHNTAAYRADHFEAYCNSKPEPILIGGSRPIPWKNGLATLTDGGMLLGDEPYEGQVRRVLRQPAIGNFSVLALELQDFSDELEKVGFEAEAIYEKIRDNVLAELDTVEIRVAVFGYDPKDPESEYRFREGK